MLSHQHFGAKPAQQPRSQIEAVGLTFIALVVIFAYANTLTSPFIFDDEHTIKNNIYIRLKSLSLSELHTAAFDSPHPHRPVSNLGFALNYYLHGENVVGYHAANIIVHLLTALFFYALIKVTMTTPAFTLDSETVSLIALLSTFLWAVHPIQTQSVSYIVQRMNSQASMFFILSMLLYAKSRLSLGKGKSRIFFCGCVLSGILAIGSKEIAATLPFFILLYEWFFFQDLDSGFPRRHILSVVVVVLLIGAVSLYFLEGNPIDRLLGGYAHRNFSPSQRLLTQARVVIFYISLLIFPYPGRLNLDHDFPLSFSLLNPVSTLGALILIAGLLTAAVLFARNQRLLSFAIFWFLGNLFIESSIIGLEIIFEHRLYLPSMFPVAAAVYMAVTRIKCRRLVIFILMLSATVGCVWTYQRNLLWADPVRFWEDCIKKSPDKSRPRNNLGIALAKRGEYEAAAEAFRVAIMRDPDKVKLHYNLAGVLVPMGKLDEAISQLKKVLDKAPANHLAHNNLALIYMRQGRLQEAEWHLRTAIRIKPDYESAYNNLGVLMRRQGELDLAISLFNKAIEMYPEYAEAHNNLGYALKMKGDIKQAIHHFEQASRLAPDYSIAQKNLEETRAFESTAGP